MPQPFGGPYLYPLPCDLALPAHEFAVGDPPDGSRWVCVGAGFRSGSVVYAEPLIVATYLVQTVFIRGAPDDVAICTSHWRWEGAGAVADTDFAAVETRMNTFWSALTSSQTTKVNSREYRWYGPRTEPGLWGENIRVTPVASSAGTAVAGLPQQVACSVTEVTDVRKRWGRFYIPCLGTGTLAGTATGNFSAAFVTLVSNAAAAMLGTDVGEFSPVVFGTPSPTSLPIRGIRVDQTPDVQRRRRQDQVVAPTVITF